LKARPFLSLAIIVVLIVLVFTAFAISGGDEEESLHNVPLPSVSLGCDRVIWEKGKLELHAKTSNINDPIFTWSLDGVAVDGRERIVQSFDLGRHIVLVNVSFNDQSQSLETDKSVIVIDSIEGVSIKDFKVSNNQWGFQTMYHGKKSGVAGVIVFVNSGLPHEVDSCGHLSTEPLSASEHPWYAEYQGKVVASDSFNLKELHEAKIVKIDLGSVYTAGGTVDGRIVLMNTGSTRIEGFDIDTKIVNLKYAWMGNTAKKEFSNSYRSNLAPGENYEIPIRITIPEKIGGVRPTGKYKITVNLLLNGKTVDTKIAHTKVT